LIGSPSGVILEMPEALSGFVTIAGACFDPGYRQAGSGMMGAEAFNRI
jgi:hypothetical protein